MNKYFHRVIFNAARGLRMVVQETARSVGKGASRSTATTAAGLFGTLVLVGSVHAQIVADPNAPGNQRPTVLPAPNGAPVVNIQAPSAAGVSRNTYKQFDVDGRGAILNNSRTNVQSQTGGWIQGNPWLARGPARIILNEVNSANPSQLRGFVEVAGQKAEVIIANPAGIQVDGGGFINAGGVTLTTGTPQFNNAGSLESFLVRGGTISIEGAGLDASRTDYAAILSRALQVNAGIWAKELKVVTGANSVSADAAQATPVAGAGAAPTFALDVSQLGGMYANKIVLIGTEAGVGVRNAGSIGAGAGELVVTSAGRLENRGTMEAARLQLASASEFDNSGGTLRQTGGNALTISAPMLSNRNGGVIGAEPVAVPNAGGGTGATEGAGAGGGGSTGTGGNGASNASGGTGSDPGAGPSADAGAPSTAATVPAPLPPGQITATDGVRNDGGRIYVGGDITLQTPQIDNSGGTLSVKELNVSGPRFANAGGTLNVRERFSANVGEFDNSGGALQAGQLDIRSDSGLSNRSGKLLASNGSATLQAGAELDNTDGVIAASDDLQVQAQRVVNDVTAANGATNAQLRAGRDLNVAAAQVNNAGAISAGRHVTLDLGSYSGGATSTLGAGLQGDGAIGQQGGNLSVKTTGALNAHGTQLAAGDMTVEATRIDLSDGQTQAQNISLRATSGDVITRSASVDASDTLKINASADGARVLDNRGGSLSAAQLELQAANIDNSAGGLVVQTGQSALQIVTGKLDNHDGGKIVQAGSLSVNAGSVDNNSGTIASQAGALEISTGHLANQSGQISSAGGDLRVDAADVDSGGDFDNASGKVQAGQAIEIKAGTIDNSGGLMRANELLALKAANVTNRDTLGQDQGIEGNEVDIATARLDKAIDQHAALDANARRLLQKAATQFGWSSRATHRALKVARTIADLAGSEPVLAAHVAEAMQYRRVAGERVG